MDQEDLGVLLGRDYAWRADHPRVWQNTGHFTGEPFLGLACLRATADAENELTRHDNPQLTKRFAFSDDHLSGLYSTQLATGRHPFDLLSWDAQERPLADQSIE
jgi:hypothetical protein